MDPCRRGSWRWRPCAWRCPAGPRLRARTRSIGIGDLGRQSRLAGATEDSSRARCWHVVLHAATTPEIGGPLSAIMRHRRPAARRRSGEWARRDSRDRSTGIGPAPTAPMAGDPAARQSRTRMPLQRRACGGHLTAVPRSEPGRRARRLPERRYSLGEIHDILRLAGVEAAARAPSDEDVERSRRVAQHDRVALAHIDRRPRGWSRSLFCDAGAERAPPRTRTMH